MYKKNSINGLNKMRECLERETLSDVNPKEGKVRCLFVRNSSVYWRQNGVGRILRVRSRLNWIVVVNRVDW